MKWIAHFTAVLIEDCKRSDYASIDLSIAEALKERAYWLYGTTSKTPAIKRDSLQRTRTAFSSTGRILQISSKLHVQREQYAERGQDGYKRDGTNST